MTAYRLYRGALAGRISRSERHRISAAGAVLRAERYGGFSNRSVLLSVEAKADAKDGLWREAVRRPMFNRKPFELPKASYGLKGERSAAPASSRAGHAATHRKPDARKQIAAGLR